MNFPLLLVALLLVICPSISEAFYSVYYFSNHKTDACKKGYAPGGGVPLIEPIKSPVAGAQALSLNYISGQLSGVSDKAIQLAENAQEFTDVFKNVAPKLVAGLGVFSGAMGLLQTVTNPTAQDLMKIVNGAFIQLTKDINDRLNKMQGYVDGRVIEQETRRITNQLQGIERQWTNCLEQSSTQASIRCQITTVDDMRKDLFHFMILDEYFNGVKKGQELSFYDVHRLEAVLLPFRDFVTYHLYSLEMLVNELEGRRDSASLHDRNKYMKQIVTDGMTYYKYAHWAYDTIVHRLVTDNKGYSKVRFGKKTEHKEGWWTGVYTHDRQIVYSGCSKDPQSPINKCGIHMTVRTDGAKPKSYTPYNVENIKPRYKTTAALLYVGKQIAPRDCSKLMKDLARDMKNFWEPELLNTADSWKLASEAAAEKLK